MSDVNWTGLRDLLVERYDELRRRLTRRLGSAELATETLHEAWLRLARAGAPAAVNSPVSYVFRVALNVAFDRRQSEARQLSVSEIEALRHLDDDELDPLRFAEARSEMAALRRALDELPPRCRAIFVAARVEEKSHAEIAEQFGGSTRMVERELKRAFDFFEQRLERTAVRRDGRRQQPENSSVSSPTRGESDPGYDD